MNRTQKNIMTGLILCAGLLIVVLYSPIGSPGLYSENNYADNQGAKFNGGAILNAVKIKYFPENNSNDLDMPEFSSGSKTKYSVGNYQMTSSSSQGSSYSVQAQSYQNNNSSSSGGMSGGGNNFIANRSSRSAGSSGIVMTNGITTMSLTTNLSNNATVRQSVNYAPNTGGTDPGGDPNPGSAIPVGDGWGLLLLFGVVYAAFKKELFTFH